MSKKQIKALKVLLHLWSVASVIAGVFVLNFCRNNGISEIFAVFYVTGAIATSFVADDIEEFIGGRNQ